MKVLGTVQVAVYDSFYTIGSDTFALGSKDVVMKVSEPREIDTDPTSVSLDYRDPMRRGGSLTLRLEKDTDISIKLYNILGQIACTLANAHLQTGTYQINLARETLSSGVYFISLETSSERVLRKVVYLQ